MIQELYDILGMDLTEIVVYSVIALVTLVGLFKCIFPLVRNASALSRAIYKLEKSTVKSDHPIWRESRFMGRSLRPQWQGFLLNAAQLDLRGIPCDTSEFLNEETVIDTPSNYQLAELLPGLLTSLGILGTFIGLMEGLTSMNFTDAAGTIESIPQLLSGMRFAFATSIAGISCSLLFNMLYRMAVGRARRWLSSFEDAFYDLAMPRPLQPDVQLLCQQQDEDARLARLMENMTARMSASLEMAVGRAMTPLTQSLDLFIKGATHEQIQGIQTIVNQFVKQLNSALNGQLDTLSENLATVNSSQLQTQQNLQNTLLITATMAKDASNISQASTQISDHISTLLAHLQSQSENQLSAVDVAHQAGYVLSQQLDALTEALAQMEKSAKSANEKLAHIAEMADALEAQKEEKSSDDTMTTPTISL